MFHMEWVDGLIPNRQHSRMVSLRRRIFAINNSKKKLDDEISEWTFISNQVPGSYNGGRISACVFYEGIYLMRPYSGYRRTYRMNNDA